MSSVPESAYALFADHGSVASPHEFIIIPGKDDCILHVDNASLFSVVGDVTTYCQTTDDAFDVDKSELAAATEDRNAHLSLSKKEQVFSMVQATLSSDIFKTIGTLETVHKLCSVCDVQLTFNSDINCYTAVANATRNIMQLEDTLVTFIQSNCLLQTPVEHSSNRDLLSQTLHQVQLDLPGDQHGKPATEPVTEFRQPTSDWLSTTIQNTISDNLIPGSSSQDATVVRVSREPEFNHVFTSPTSSSKYFCSSCSFSSTQMRQLRRHMSIHMTSSSGDVIKQQAPYNTRGASLQQTDEQVANSDKLSVVGDKLRCTLCVYETVHRHLFKRHVDTVHGNLRPYLCDVCGRGYKRSDSLAQHRVIHSAQESRVYLHQCSTCQRKFRSLSHLKEHVSTHTSARSFLCELCGAALKSRSAQRKHMLSIHVEPRAYSCPSCSRRFNTSFAMRRHARLHDNISSNITTQTRRNTAGAKTAVKSRRSSKLNELLSIITAK